MTSPELVEGRAIRRASYGERRSRALDLAGRWTFAAEVLQFYRALLDVQEAAFDEARDVEPRAAAAFAAERVVPKIVEVSATHGPAALQRGVLERFDTIDFLSTIGAWLNGDALDSVDRFLARAATAPVLQALGSRVAEICTGPREGDRCCPACGGVPQLAYIAAGDEDLVTTHRYLECSRCATSWAFARMTCASCGENAGERLLHFSEIGALEAEFSGLTVRGAERERMDASALRQGQGDTSNALMPHVSVDGCRTCSTYLLTVDVRREPRAVPVVDELAALPLWIYAQERGLAKVVPNQLGF